jgi:hypothetical protein
MRQEWDIDAWMHDSIFRNPVSNVEVSSVKLWNDPIVTFIHQREHFLYSHCGLDSC